MPLVVFSCSLSPSTLTREAKLLFRQIATNATVMTAIPGHIPRQFENIVTHGHQLSLFTRRHTHVLQPCQLRLVSTLNSSIIEW